MRKGRFLNTDASAVIGDFPWYEMVWRGVRGDFRPRRAPAGGYAAFAQAWSLPVDLARIHRRSQSPRVTWLGHVAVLLQVAGANILTDPVLSGFAGPRGRMGAPRRVPAPLAVEQLPPIDWVLISHNHYDHLDYDTVMRLAAAGQRPRYLVPLGIKAWFDAHGIGNVTELNWWQRIDAGPLAFHFTPAQHWSRRTPLDTNRSLWGGYAVEWRPAGAVPWRWFFPGDTGYSRDFADIARRIGTMDFVALPIGAYLPRDFMGPMHINPMEAVQIFRDVGARHAMGVHWGTFELTQEAFDEPPADLAAACAAQGVDASRIWLMKHGETRDIAVPPPL